MDIKKLDKLFSEYIRKRDKVCQKCGRTDTLACAHIHSRKNRNTRWDEDNALTLCYACHLHWAHKEPIEFAEFIRKYLGNERFEKLYIRKQTVVKGLDYKMIEVYLKEKIKRLEKL